MQDIELLPDVVAEDFTIFMTLLILIVMST